MFQVNDYVMFKREILRLIDIKEKNKNMDYYLISNDRFNIGVSINKSITLKEKVVALTKIIKKVYLISIAKALKLEI